MQNIFSEYNMLEAPPEYSESSSFTIPQVQEIQLATHLAPFQMDYGNNNSIFFQLESPFGTDNNQTLQISLYEPSTQKVEEVPTTNNKGAEVVNIARQFLNHPYKWGKASPREGFDCSGLIQYSYKQIGIDLPRTSHAMSKIGDKVELSEVQPGDIIYTNNKGQGHVRMVSNINDGHIYVIEASNSRTGIVERELTKTSDIKAIRRVINTSVYNNKSSRKGVFQDSRDFVRVLNSTYRESLKEHNLDPNYSYILTAAAALESGWGKKLGGSFNYGGVKGKVGTVSSTVDYVYGRYVRRNQTFRNFKSVKDYCDSVIETLQKKRYNAFNTYSSSNPMKFWRHVLDAGYGGGDTNGKNKYMRSVYSIYNTIIQWV